MYVNGSVTTPVEAPPKEARHTSIVVAVLAQAWRLCRMTSSSVEAIPDERSTHVQTATGLIKDWFQVNSNLKGEDANYLNNFLDYIGITSIDEMIDLTAFEPLQSFMQTNSRSHELASGPAPSVVKAALGKFIRSFKEPVTQSNEQKEYTSDVSMPPMQSQSYVLATSSGSSASSSLGPGPTFVAQSSEYVSTEPVMGAFDDGLFEEPRRQLLEEAERQVICTNDEWAAMDHPRKKKAKPEEDSPGAIWEFGEWYQNNHFWCEMDVELSMELETVAREGASTHQSKNSVWDQYTWDFVNMIQYHDFMGRNDIPRQTSRSIRRCYVLHAPWTGDPRKDRKRDISLPHPEPEPECQMDWGQPIWEFEEQYNGEQYWAEMDPEYVSRLNLAYNIKDLVEFEKYDEDWWYEWHFDIMTQYCYFFDEWGCLRCRSRGIRRIVVQRPAFNQFVS